MIFLGQASNYRAGQVLRHVFAWGRTQDSAQLRARLAEVYGAKQGGTGGGREAVYLYHTGRSALAAAFRALAPEGSEIFIPGLTCIAVVRAVREAGCVPVFVDINPKTLQYDWEALDKKLKVCYNGKIIVAQNTLGLPLDMMRLEKIARERGLKIVEDLAHSAGRVYPDGRAVGTVGSATVLSFGKGKAIDTIAGGALVLREKAKVPVAEPTELPHWSDRWRERWYPLLGALIRVGYHVGLGKLVTAVFLKFHWIQRSADAKLSLTTRLTHWQAKLAYRQLDRLPQTPLRGHDFVPDRSGLLRTCKSKGWYLDEIWYDQPVSPARYAEEARFPAQDCPQTVKVAAEIINYPSWYSAEKLAPVKALVKAWQVERGADMRSGSIQEQEMRTGESMEAEWQEICQRYPEANFLQSPAWGRMNQLIGHKVMIKASAGVWCQMIVKNARRGRYLEVPGGPLLDWSNAGEVERVFAEIRQVARAEGCVFARVRPQLERSTESLELMRRLGARPAPMHLHAEHTIVIDLRQSEDDLLKNLRKQTRYEVRRAEKMGIKVEWGNSEALFREFHTVQTATASRQHFVPPDLKTLLAERAAFGEQARIYVARTAEGDAVAYGLVLINGVEAEYFEAASTELNRKIPGAYALQWQAMRDLKALGIKRYNLWGIAPPGTKQHRYAGVTTFKMGFGGKVVEYIHAQDIVIKSIRYQIDWWIETVRKKKRHL